MSSAGAGAVPTRTTVVWIVLVAATCGTWWLGTGHAGGRGLNWELLLLIAVAFGKIWLVGEEFMELRHAPRSLRLAFTAWIAAVGVGAAVLTVQ